MADTIDYPHDLHAFRLHPIERQPMIDDQGAGAIANLGPRFTHVRMKAQTSTSSLDPFNHTIGGNGIINCNVQPDLKNVTSGNRSIF